MNVNQTTLGVDLGMGAMKLFDKAGGVQLPAFVAIGGAAPVRRTLGLAATKPALHITVGNQPYLVGLHAHDQGRPIENLDYERLTGSPEIRALFYAALTERIRAYGPLDAPIACLVGLPLEPLTGDEAKSTVAAVRKWLKGDHVWKADGMEQSITVADVQVTSQPAGALFDYLLDDEARFIPERKGHMTKELGIVSVGFNTIELLAVRDKTPVQRFTAGSTVGVRRLLELLNREGHYSLGELDALLRAGALDTSEALPLWAREVTGVIERTWGRQWRRFARILVVGGGAMLLGDHLTGRFEGKAIVPDQPILAIARGLYKQAEARAQAVRRREVA